MPNSLLEPLKTSPINSIIVCALACEAKPFIDLFKLKKNTAHHAFSVYQSGAVLLIVTGMGQTNAAAAVNWLNGVLNAKSPKFYLNIGVAGHKNAAIGSLLCVCKIDATDQENSVYPTKWQKHKIPLAALSTLNAEELNYPKEQLYDMEGFAFYQAAIRFNAQEQVQCLKIVSDNQQQAVNRDKAFISGLIETHRDDIIGFIAQHVTALEHVYTEDKHQQWVAQITHALRFSHSQQLQLIKLCRSAQSHHIAVEAINADNAKELLQQITGLLKEKAVAI